MINTLTITFFTFMLECKSANLCDILISLTRIERLSLISISLDEIMNYLHFISFGHFNEIILSAILDCVVQ